MFRFIPRQGRGGEKAAGVWVVDPKGDPAVDAFAFQAAMDEAEQAGGGTVILGAGRFLLSFTPQIPSNVHVIGQGKSTILTGTWSRSNRAGLISNKNINADAYEGASDFSLRNVAIDSYNTNGIMFAHAENIVVSDIYGIDVGWHFVDLGGVRNLRAERLFFTGEAGTAAFQIDSLPPNATNRIWSGTGFISPKYDGTGCDGIYVIDSEVSCTIRSGSENHAFQLHKSTGKNVRIENVTIRNIANGVALDGSFSGNPSSFSDVSLTNVTMIGGKRFFRMVENPMEGMTYARFSFDGCIAQDLEEKFGTFEIFDNLRITNTTVSAHMDGATDIIRIAGCRDVLISGVSLRSIGGSTKGTNGAINVLESLYDTPARKSSFVRVVNSMIQDSNVGLRVRTDGTENVIYAGMQFDGCETDISGTADTYEVS